MNITENFKYDLKYKFEDLIKIDSSKMRILLSLDHF